MILALHGIDSCITAYLVKRHTSLHAIVVKQLVWKLDPRVRYRNKNQVAKKSYHWFKFFIQEYTKKLTAGDVKSAIFEFSQLCYWRCKSTGAWRSVGRGVPEVSKKSFSFRLKTKVYYISKRRELRTQRHSMTVQNTWTPIVKSNLITLRKT